MRAVITGVSTALGPRILTRFSIRATVLAGFAVLAVASPGVLLIGTGTSLWLIARARVPGKLRVDTAVGDARSQATVAARAVGCP